MVNYGNSKIYEIVCNVTGLRYVGSTTKKTLAQRLAEHVYKFRAWKKGDGFYVTSFKVLEGGNYSMVLLELFPCTIKDELHARERHYIQSLECVNKIVPLRTKAEYYVDNTDYINERQKRYKLEHVDELATKNRQYRVDNAETIKAKKSQPHLCETCDCSVRHCEIARHTKTKKHLNNVHKQTKSPTENPNTGTVITR